MTVLRARYLKRLYSKVGVGPRPNWCANRQVVSLCRIVPGNRFVVQTRERTAPPGFTGA